MNLKMSGEDLISESEGGGGGGGKQKRGSLGVAKVPGAPNIHSEIRDQDEGNVDGDIDLQYVRPVLKNDCSAAPA